MKRNKENRYRMNDFTARKLGLVPNKQKRYRLKPKQVEQYFNICMGKGIKRLFFDIETSPYKGYFWSQFPKFIPHDQVIELMKIICISYKWEGEEKIHRLTWDKNQCDKQMISEFIKIMNEADECVAHNGDRYDIRVLRTRAVFHRIPMMPKYRTLDTLKKSRSGFRFFSNKLDNIAQELGVGAKVKHEGWSMWERTINGDLSALEEMGNYCDGDIVVLEDVYLTLQPYIKPNTHAGVHQGNEKHSCPICGNNEDLILVKNDVTQKGTLSRVIQCDSCGHVYNISNNSYRLYMNW